MKSVAALLLIISSTAFAKSQSNSYTSSAFVPPASPATTTSSHQQKAIPSTQTFTQTRVIQGVSPGRNGLPLFAKQKKDSTTGKGGKIQVKLTKHIAGTGQAGDVIMVAPAFFQNSLLKSGSAVRISNDEVEKASAEKAQLDKDSSLAANDMKAKLDDRTLSLSKKAGPDGQLFGGIGFKCIMEELKKEFPAGCLDAKYIKITSFKDDDGKVLKHDIKSVGDYTATISLLKGVSADFKIEVTGEE
jgi:large subunit ribosomal protein L9